MVYDRETAARRAEASVINTPDGCQYETRLIFDAPSVGDFDGDGAADAEDGWKSEPAHAKHTDRHPPRGVPVAYLGGSHDNGHRAISLGNGMIRSTDAGGRGRWATVPLDWPEKTWGLTYAGWSETIDGVQIPLPPAVREPAPAQPAPTQPKVTRPPGVQDTIDAAKKAKQTATKTGHPVRAKKLGGFIAGLRRLGGKK